MDNNIIYKNGWNRDLHIRWPKILIHKEKILVTERETHLVCIDPATGNIIWDHNISVACGWLTAINDKVFYLDNGYVKIIDFNTGKSIQTYQLAYQYMGYVLVNDKYLITGSWRGYTDLMCLNWNSDFKIEWTKKTMSKDNTSYSIPKLLNESIIFSDDLKRIIMSIDISTGTENWSVSLPENIETQDLGSSFQINKGNIFVYSKDGRIYRLDEQTLTWEVLVQHSTGIKTVTAKILDTQFLFQDNENNICSYDRLERKLNWKIRSNGIQFFLPALEITPELTLICLAMKRKLIIDKAGKHLHEFQSERRYGSDLILINNAVYYMTKSKIKQLTRNVN